MALGKAIEAAAAAPTLVAFGLRIRVGRRRRKRAEKIEKALASARVARFVL